MGKVTHHNTRWGAGLGITGERRWVGIEPWHGRRAHRNGPVGWWLGAGVPRLLTRMGGPKIARSGLAEGVALAP